MAAGESVGASTAKVAMITAGAAMSNMKSVGDTLGVTGQDLIWFVTFAYGVLQLIKAMPWLSDQTFALWLGIRHGNWSRWWSIARRGEHSIDHKPE